MNTTIIQIAALACYGNAVLHGVATPRFYPDNSTTQFCEFIKFIVFQKPLLGAAKEVTVAETPDLWLAALPGRTAVCLKLSQQPRNLPNAPPDRMLDGFIGGGRTWKIEVLLTNGTTELWQARWIVGDQKAPDRRIWQVTYGLTAIVKTTTPVLRPLSAIKADLQRTLWEIHRFSEEQNCGAGFTAAFANALQALDSPGGSVQHFQDLFPPGIMTEEADSLAQACMTASVFGGMGSWNDMSFEGDLQKEYDRVSEALFTLTTEGMEAAITSTASPITPGIAP